jgi:2Fe-2S ferredoxin
MYKIHISFEEKGLEPVTIYVNSGEQHLESISDKEEDFIDRAVNPRLNSRLGCQCILLAGQGDISITLPDQTQFLGE